MKYLGLREYGCYVAESQPRKQTIQTQIQWYTQTSVTINRVFIIGMTLNLAPLLTHHSYSLSHSSCSNMRLFTIHPHTQSLTQLAHPHSHHSLTHHVTACLSLTHSPLTHSLTHHSPTHSLTTHPFTHSPLTHSLTHSLTHHSPIHSLTHHSPIHSLTHSPLTHSLTHSPLTHSLTHSLTTHPFTHPLTHSLIHSLTTHPLTHPSTPLTQCYSEDSVRATRVLVHGSS